ncbi:hypothetical protein R3X27_08555 [Tropicimonas sp. TH_r6]|uniref:hypothetical protein n=1 Tax=Tropicimonas sp. TH_r6 TaxID=3082085 RepID=UPI002954DA06|nr:hypothetical protein [Tropicimonas sp. TH_r6]MDV7142732.1 hypothetical protein [Tropicimonas sp. TH_r6]
MRLPHDRSFEREIEPIERSETGRMRHGITFFDTDFWPLNATHLQEERACKRPVATSCNPDIPTPPATNSAQPRKRLLN